MALARERFAQHGFGIGNPIFLVINPAQAVQITAVIGLFFQRALDQRLCFVETDSQVAKHVTVIIQHRSVFGVDRKNFFELLFGLVIKLLALVNGAEEEPDHFVVARLAGQDFSGTRGFFGFFVAAAALVNLRDVHIGIAIGGVSMQVRAQDFDGIVGLRVFAEQQSIAGANSRVGGVLRHGFLAGLEIPRQILGGAVGVHDHHARTAVFFVAQVAELFKSVNRRLVILDFAIELSELLIQNRKRALSRRHGGGLALDSRYGIGENANRIVVAALRFVQHSLVVHDLEAAWRILARLHQIFFGFVELM